MCRRVNAVIVMVGMSHHKLLKLLLMLQRMTMTMTHTQDINNVARTVNNAVNMDASMPAMMSQWTVV